MWSFIAHFTRFIILTTATIGVSILISFVTKLNFNKIEPKSTLAHLDSYHAVIMNKRDYKCSATVIDSKNVITLASCVRNDLPAADDKPSIRVWIGYPSSDWLDERGYDVKKIILHPGYEHRSRKDDIAIIQLTEALLYYPPISYLPKKRADKGLELYVTGYGIVEYSRSKLHRFNMTIIDGEKCRKHVATKKLPTEQLLDMSKKFCAIAEHGFDHPQTSWGSPATVDREYMVGIYLGHVNYGNTPGIFINVSDYISFIDQHIT